MLTSTHDFDIISGENFHQLFSEAPAPIAIYKGRELRYVFVNDAYHKIFNYRELLGKTLRDAFPELVGQPYFSILEEVFDTGVPYFANETPAYIDLNSDGNITTRYYNLVYTPFRNQGVISGVMAFGHDVTEQVQARLREKESESRFRNIIEQSSDPILILKGEKMVLDMANQSLFNLWNVDSTAIGKTFLEILPEMEDQGFMDLLTDVFKNSITHYGYESPATFKRADGRMETVYFNFVYQPYKEADGSVTGVLVIATDVTAQVQASEKIREKEKSFHNLIMQAPVGICILHGHQFQIELANEAFMALLGKSAADAIGKHLWNVIPEARSEEFNQTLKGVMETGFHFKAIEYPVTLNRNEKEEVIYVDFVYEPLSLPNGAVERIMILAIETTDKVLARQKIEESEKDLQNRVEERTAELEKKNSELEQYAQVSSHDLQEPLRKIRMYSDMIRKSDFEKLSEASQSRLDKIADAVKRMSTSLTDLLNFTSLSKEEQFAPVDLNEVVAGVTNDLELLIEQKNAVVEYKDLPVVSAIPLQMQQLFYNLVNNALKFSKQDTIPHISIHAEKLYGRQLAHNDNLKPDRLYHQVILKDNGIGFDQSYSEKIFSMFQRLHNRQAYSGTGIGLALCKKVVLNHEGDISAVSADGEGATFYVILPAGE